MISTDLILIIALPIVGIALCIFAGVKILSGRTTQYQRKMLMTANESEFHDRLKDALPDEQIYPQIPILALLEPKSRAGSQAYQKAFREISNRRVDWVVETDLSKIVIELDDRTHDAKQDARRDEILNSCGYRVIRYESRAKPSIEKIRTDVLGLQNTSGALG